MNRVNVNHSVGYCPQEDAMLPNLTVAEHLHLVAMLRDASPDQVTQLAASLRLARHLPVRCHQLSGGMRRKLCAASALLGAPRLLLLDEPSSGVDVNGRRLLWSRVRETARAGAAVLLTSHSMEECEALCDRLAIMVNGQLQCIGNLQHLKGRFGRGYSIRLRVSESDADNVTFVQRALEQVLPTAILRECHGCLLHFHISADAGDGRSARLADLFAQIEVLRGRLGGIVCSFALCQTSLDEIFINFAKLQQSPTLTRSHKEKLRQLLQSRSFV